MAVEEVAAALERLGPALRPGGKAVDLRRLSGGASLETFAFALLCPDGARLELILRRRPPGQGPRDERTVALATEAALIAAVAARGAPVPEVLRVCPPEDGLGEAVVMAKVEGEALGRRIVRDAQFDAVRPGLARRCGEVLAVVHATPTRHLPPLLEAGPSEELARYEEIYRASGARRPTLEWAFRRLALSPPRPRPPVLLHGDFRNGNLLINPQKGLVAVLDWELAHLGHPASDLGWLCVNSWRFGAAERPVGGFGATADLLAGYAAAGGAALDQGELRYFEMFGSLKWGVMCLIMLASYESGADPSVERAMIGRRVSEAEIDLLNLMEAKP